MMKRLLDITISFTGLFLLSPLFLLIGFFIKIDSAGPIFYRGIRVGIHGRQFRIFKFRTMVVGAEKIGGPSTPDDDPRITEVGKFLRKYKFDELPQFINVLKGEMSIVGPRPEVASYIAIFIDEEKRLLAIRPGMTDWASLWNYDEGNILRGSPDPEKAYMEKIRPKKIRLQLEYVKHHPFMIDIKIILKTLRLCLKKGFDGADEKNN